MTAPADEQAANPGRRAPKITRDLVLFTAGLGLTVNEAVVRNGTERPSLLVLFAAMMGLPALLRYDESRRNGNGK